MFIILPQFRQPLCLRFALPFSLLLTLLAPHLITPFCLAQGDRAQLVGINVVGLRRAGWSREKIQAIRSAFRTLFLADTARLVALERTEGDLAGDHPEVKEMIDFIRSSERGICPPRSGLPSTDPFEG